jgi:hypothetical protein
VIAHILNAGVRALAASVILGGVLIYAVGGVDSPDARPITIATIGGFFLFWGGFISCSASACQSPRATRPAKRTARETGRRAVLEGATMSTAAMAVEAMADTDPHLPYQTAT